MIISSKIKKNMALALLLLIYQGANAMAIDVDRFYYECKMAADVTPVSGPVTSNAYMAWVDTCYDIPYITPSRYDGYTQSCLDKTSATRKEKEYFCYIFFI